MNRKEYNNEYDVFEAPKDLWGNIEAKLDAPQKKRRIGWWSSVGGVAAVLLVTLFVLNQQEEPHAPEKKHLSAMGMNTNSPSATDDGPQYSGVPPRQKSKRVENQQQKSVGQSQQLKKEYKSNGEYTTTLYDGTASYSANAQGSSANTYNWDVLPNVYSDNVTGWAGNAKPNGLHYKKGKAIKPAEFDQWEIEEPTHGSNYDVIIENMFVSTAEQSQSTFSIDVDGASYSDVRGMIQRGHLPNPNAVRLEELINYFPYNYEDPSGEHPFSFHTEITDCPWNTNHRLMKIGIKGEAIEKEVLPPNNLVFLLDVSGSMTSDDKLGLIKKGFNLLVQEMREEDRIAICVYAGAAGVVLEPTSGANKDKIMDAINQLEAGGSTAGGQGIELAYATAQKYFNANGNNRVILATDGDFNVGVSNDDALVSLIERKRASGVALTVLGVGHDNFQSSKMEKLANNGNGNFSYIDNILEAKKVLVTEMGATLKTIAKDVKIQLDFNPELVSGYRLIGYENRLLTNDDFDNDAIDAGELGAGHTVTAIYEIIPGPAEGRQEKSTVENLINIFSGNTFKKDDLAVLKFRYKQPQGKESQLIRTNISSVITPTSTDMQFISAVVEFGLLLRNSDFKGTANYDRILRNARLGLGRDAFGYRSEFIQLVQKAQQLQNE